MLLTELSELDQKQFLEELKDYLIPYRHTIDVDAKYTFGIEIEFVKAFHIDIKKCMTKEMENNWDFFHEVSLNEQQDITHNINGGEMTSKRFCDNLECWKQIKKMCEFLKENDADINEKCGGHVHIGSQALNKNKNFKRFLKLWIIFEDVIYRFGYGESITYRSKIKEMALPFSTKLNNYLLGNHKINVYNINRSLSCYKRYGIDFSKTYSLNKELPNNTVEFRCPNGTLNHIVWQNNVNFFMKLLLHCNESSNWDLINKYLKTGTISDGNIENYQKLNIKKAMLLADFIFDEEIDKKNFLKQYIKDNKQKKITF